MLFDQPLQLASNNELGDEVIPEHRVQFGACPADVLEDITSIIAPVAGPDF